MIKYEMVQTPAGWVVVKFVDGTEVARTNAHNEETSARICLNLRWAK